MLLLGSGQHAQFEAALGDAPRWPRPPPPTGRAFGLWPALAPPPASTDAAASEPGPACRRKGRHAAACSGDAGNDVRIRVPMRVAGDACKRPALRVRLAASGGLDCDGALCPAIGLAAQTNAQLGCG